MGKGDMAYLAIYSGCYLSSCPCSTCPPGRPSPFPNPPAGFVCTPCTWNPCQRTRTLQLAARSKQQSCTCIHHAIPKPLRHTTKCLPEPTDCIPLVWLQQYMMNPNIMPCLKTLSQQSREGLHRVRVCTELAFAQSEHAVPDAV